MEKQVTGYPSREVPEIPFINSITPLDQATDIQTDDSPKTECLQSWSTLKTKMPRTSQILSDLKLAFDIHLKLAPKHLKCTALDNQSYKRSHNLSPK
ncbi:hypothetical protein CDAR_412441 [Caerostris darwini]|uniref:Uncharacterized protein n=1 Tax=Caerostris darwini TaxID=1538125 RepID=A0AAV4WW75_9ARAC|nr:hypothetical protein CDAR_412441 [Caerostris darwini]